jgi:hypothetical protein
MIMSGFASGVGGPNPANHYTALLAVLDALQTGYRPTITDLGDFANYETETTSLALESIVSNDGWTGSGSLITALRGTGGISATNAADEIGITFETTPTGIVNGTARNIRATVTYTSTERAGDFDAFLGVSILDASNNPIAEDATSPTLNTTETVTHTFTFSDLPTITDAALATARLFIHVGGINCTWTLKNFSLTYDYDGPVSPNAAADVRLGTDLGDGTLGTLDLPDEPDVLLGVTYDGATKTGTYAAVAVDPSTLAAEVAAALASQANFTSTRLQPAARWTCSGATATPRRRAGASPSP